MPKVKYSGVDYAEQDRQRHFDAVGWARERGKLPWSYSEVFLADSGKGKAWAKAVLARSPVPRERGVWNLSERLKFVLDRLTSEGIACLLLLVDEEEDILDELSYEAALGRARGPFPGRGE